MTPSNVHQQTAHDDPLVWAPRLARFLDESIALYEHLLELAQRQTALIENQEHDSLLTLLTDRQKLVEQIAEHATLLDPFTSRWSDLEELLSSDQRDELRPRLDRLSTLMQDIVRCDETDRERLAKMRDDAARQLTTLDQNRRAASAYSGAHSPPAPPRYQDRTG